ncbi:uncharacterized protein LOC129594489 [Paramacrobiotus metropolitanus]|uniref:uncharacterized protein LOC129594489 n=1 Tax=Paramacrobiotus metropolitanus TaxID=2943436 RepID=UPI002445F21F|nr:uncharacterized protein LOC129594489 [Paramacrobiotus metropolitanus]
MRSVAAIVIACHIFAVLGAKTRGISNEPGAVPSGGNAGGGSSGGKLLQSTQPDTVKSTVMKKDPKMFEALDGFVNHACNWFKETERQAQCDYIQDNIKAKYPNFVWNNFVFDIKAKWDYAVWTDATYKGTCGNNHYFIFGIKKLTSG